jgi:hypothetical protein
VAVQTLPKSRRVATKKGLESWHGHDITTRVVDGQ